MRLFLALDLDAAIRSALAQAIAELRREAPRARWVRPETLHLTLHFLGETEAGRAAGLRAALDAVCAAAFQLPLRGWGFFPAAGPAHVFWAGVELHPALLRLHAQLQPCLAQLGWAPEASYAPHLTLARARHARELARLKPLLERPAPAWGVLPVREFVLYESRPQAGEHVYLPLARYALAGVPAG